MPYPRWVKICWVSLAPIVSCGTIVALCHVIDHQGHHQRAGSHLPQDWTKDGQNVHQPQGFEGAGFRSTELVYATGQDAKIFVLLANVLWPTFRLCTFYTKDLNDQEREGTIALAALKTGSNKSV